MIEDVIGNYLDTLQEREFDAPFMALLRARGFWDIHFTHGSAEFGKDFVAKGMDNSEVCQFAFQLKAGDVPSGAWREIRTQVDLLRDNDISHPAFDLNLPRRAILVTTGRLTGNAPVEAQNYRQRLQQRGDLLFELWDKQTLVERLSHSPEIGLSGKTEGEIYRLIGKIESDDICDYEIEKFSRRWIGSLETAEQLWKAAIETAIIAARLRSRERIDLSCYTSLCLVRAAWASTNASAPPNAIGLSVAEAGKTLFTYYATSIWQECSDEDLDPLEFIQSRNLGASFLTYPVCCSKLIEVLGFLGLLHIYAGQEEGEKIADYLVKFLERHSGAAHPVSDRWAVSLIPPVLLLAKTGRSPVVRKFLEHVVRWVCDHYESTMMGLASSHSKPEEEVDYLLGSPFEHIAVVRRNESYLSTVVLDLISVLEMGDLFDVARNDFLAVDACSSVIETDDSENQYLLNPTNLNYIANIEYLETWQPTDNWKVASHHFRAPESLYLLRINRVLDILAVSCVLRDRHFLSAHRSILNNA